MHPRTLTAALGAALALCAAPHAAPARPAPAGIATRPALPRLISRAPGATLVRFEIHVPLHHRSQIEGLVRLQSTKGSAFYRHFLTPDQFRAAYGVNAADLARARRDLAANGLRLVTAGTQDITVEGNATNVERAVHAQLWSAARPGIQAPAIVGRGALASPVSIPGSTVVGLDATVLRHIHSAVVKAPLGAPRPAAAPNSDLSPLGGYLTSDLKQAYKYPSYTALTGKGAAIGILVDGDFIDDDMRVFFGVQNLSVPTLVRRPVDGGASSSDPDSIETELDIQQSGGMAPGATIVHYNIPDLSDQSVYDGYKAIVDDNRVDVVNSSFGGCERYYDGAYTAIFGPAAVPATLLAQDDLMLQGVAQGQSFVASSGDNGAYACFSPADILLQNPNAKPILGVEFPASSPHVTAVGGTNLKTSYGTTSTASTYVSENAYADAPNPVYSVVAWGSGGGESLLFPQPYYQSAFGIPTKAGRNVPDIAGHMGGCPGYALQPCGPDRSSDLMTYYGAFINILGTSASSPDFAGLLALTNQFNLGRLGNADPMIYSLAAAPNAATVYHGNVPGNNGLPAKPGYDEVTGVGSVNGLAFTGFLAGAVAGDPGTPSNPGPQPSVTFHAQPFTALSLGRGVIDPSALPQIGVEHDFPIVALPATGFDGTSRRCAPAQPIVYDHMRAFQCDPSGFALAVSSNRVLEAFPNQIALYTTRGALVPGWPKTAESFFGPNHFTNSIASGCTQFVVCRGFTSLHAAVDPKTGRFWLEAVETDSYYNIPALPPVIASQWVAVSQSADPGGKWNVYQFGVADAQTQTASFGGGFGFDDTAVYLSGNQVRFGYDAYGLLAFSYAYVFAADKAAMQSGLPVVGRGFQHLTANSFEIDSPAPAHPAFASDEVAGPGYFAATVRPRVGNACLVPGGNCQGVYVLALSDPLGTPQLSATRATTKPYTEPPNTWNSLSCAVLCRYPMYASVQSMPVLANQTISLAFDAGETTASGLVNAVKWLTLAPHLTGVVLTATNVAEGDIIPTASIPDFGVATPDGKGNLYVTYATVGNTIDQSYIVRRSNGSVDAPRTVFSTDVRNLTPDAGEVAANGVLKPGFGAAALAGGRVWFAAPYVVPKAGTDPTNPFAYVSSWITAVP